MTRSSRQKRDKIYSETRESHPGASNKEIARLIRNRLEFAGLTLEAIARDIDRWSGRQKGDSRVRLEVRILSRFSVSAIAIGLVVVFALVLLGGTSSTLLEPFSWNGFYLWMIALAITLGMLFMAHEALERAFLNRRGKFPAPPFLIS